MFFFYDVFTLENTQLYKYFFQDEVVLIITPMFTEKETASAYLNISKVNRINYVYIMLFALKH